jgi:hypothetical protein
MRANRISENFVASFLASRRDPGRSSGLRPVAL